jgi:hypothetical protein
MSRHVRTALWALCVGGFLSVASSVNAGHVIVQDLTIGGTATGSPANSPAAEAPGFAFDNLASTKGLIFNGAAAPFSDVSAVNPVIWTYSFAGAVPQTVQSYTLTSANDAPERDPRDFFLEGSNNGTTWNTVDTVTGHQFNEQPGFGDNTNTTNRFETYIFPVDTPGSFSQYRLRIIETFGTTNDRPQIAEIQLFSNVVVPEPTAAGVLVGVAGLFATRRRRA